MPIDKNKDIQLTTVISKELHKELKQIADEQERTINKQAAHILKEYASNYRKKK